MRFIKEYVLKDLKLKGLSLVLAAMLWFAISYIGESKMTVSVPVTAENLGKNLLIGKMETDAVLVTIGGPISILKNLRARDIRLSVNLSGAKEGAQVFTLEKESVTVPKGVKIEEVKPDYLAIKIDKAVEKRLKVVVKLDEKWANTYGVKSWYPHYVVVAGAEEELADKYALETAPVDGNFVDRDEEVDVPLAVKGMLFKKITPETVRVRIRRN
jgi:YbbR domain-containing protein